MSAQHHDLGGELVKAAYAQNQAEAEMIQGLLEVDGIISVLQAVGVNGLQLGFGVLARNPQRVLVRADQAEQARALLAQTPIEDEGAWPDTDDASHLQTAGGRGARSYGLIGAYARIYLWSLGAVVVAVAIFLLLPTA